MLWLHFAAFLIGLPHGKWLHSAAFLMHFASFMEWEVGCILLPSSCMCLLHGMGVGLHFAALNSELELHFAAIASALAISLERTTNALP